MGGGELVLGDRRGPHAVAALDLVDGSAMGSPASSRATVCRPTTWARSQRAGGGRRRSGSAPCVEVGDEPAGLGGQRGRACGAGSVGLGRPAMRRAVVGVDEAVDVAAEASPSSR